MEALKLAVSGINGRMGALVGRLVRDAKDLSLVGAVVPEPSARASAEEAARALGLAGLDDIAGVRARGAQVLVDFTVGEATANYAQACAEVGLALVSGTTGLNEGQRARVLEAARRIPILWAPNMSVGVHAMVAAARELAQNLGDGFDVEVVELHHRYKKDAPSGTALRLAQEVAQALGRGPEVLRCQREGLVGERPSKEIGVQTLRGGDVVGEHTIYFLAEGERVELTHRATSREQFARGALRAARWLVGQAPGLYGMEDVLAKHSK